MLRIRLRRVGAKKQPHYRIVVMSGKKPRDGAAIEELGHYDPRAEEPMPVGAMVVKDSFSLAASGGLARGPLFTMEKMTPGFFPAGGDWRYTMIMPNGKVFGSTNGEGSAAVAFCAECHKQAGKRDFLFDLPDAFAVGK